MGNGVYRARGDAIALAPARLRRSPRWPRVRQNATAYLFLAPNLVFFVLFLLLPIGWVIRQSFMEGGVLGPASWVGLDNWSRAFGDPELRQSLRNTLLFAVLFVPVALSLAMVVALLLRRVQRGAATLRAIVYLPSLAPVVLAAIVWIFLVNPDLGLLNALNRALGADPINFLGDRALALPTLVAVETWRSLGFWALFLLAALLAVPKDLYQAAEIDGASESRRFWHITMPGIRAPFLIAVLLAILASMQWFDSSYVLTGGGPAGATESAVFYVYRNTFEQGKVGYGAVLSLVLVIATVLITFAVVRLLKPRTRPSTIASAVSGRVRRLRRRVAEALARISLMRRVNHVAAHLRERRARLQRQDSLGSRQPGRRMVARGGATYIGLAIVALVAAVPFLYILSASFKDQAALITYPPQWIPNPIDTANYTRILFDLPYPRWLLNTFIVAGTVTIIKVFFDSMAAYAFAKLQFVGREPLYWLMLIAVMIPGPVLIIPLFFLARDAGLLDTYWALILPPLANPLGIFIMRGFIQGLPKDLENAARLDGCNAFQIYWRVILPLVKPGLVVVAILTFLTQYLNFVWPLIVTESPEHYVLTVGLAKLKNNLFPDWGLISAGAVLTLVPMIVIFLLFQRRFVQASLAGALKE